MPLEDDAGLAALLERVRSVAVVGIKDGETEDACRVPRYLQQQGLRILPVSPKLDHVLGEPCVASLADLKEAPDLVCLFRAPAHVPGHADEILALEPPPSAVWMQLGIRHPAATARLEAAGITVIEDRCMMIEHRRLLAERPA